MKNDLKVFNNKILLQEEISSLKKKDQTIGFVPTMGALHRGHISLVKNALERCDVVVVSIFINPTQFDNQEDLEKYPKTLQKDVDLLKTLNESNILVYAPSTDDIYENNVSAQSFDFGGIENEMEGAYRKGHFDGVATIVKRFFEIVEPNYAFFGEKDFQQLQIVKALVRNYAIPVNIISCPIYREEDGLAMSSRNVRLSKKLRMESSFIYKTLITAKNRFGIESANSVMEWVKKQFERNVHFELEYFVIADAETLKPIKRKTNKNKYRAFIAVYAGDVRLIDNIALN